MSTATLSRSKRFSLSYIGKDWEHCFMDFKSLTFKQAASMAQLDFSTMSAEQQYDANVLFLTDMFISGKGLDAEGNQVSLDANDILELEPSAIAEIIQLLGGTDPKS